MILDCSSLISSLTRCTIILKCVLASKNQIANECSITGDHTLQIDQIAFWMPIVPVARRAHPGGSATLQGHSVCVEVNRCRTPVIQ